MATQTFTLAEAPARFRFRVGDRVARTDAEGYADLEHAGVVADGRWTGDPSGGSYDETYRIRRDDGNYFRAREIHLLGLFDDASLREEIRRLLKARKLPRDLPSAPGETLQGHETIREGGRGKRCSACGHLIPVSDPRPMEYAHSDKVYRFHEKCNAIWLAEKHHR